MQSYGLSIDLSFDCMMLPLLPNVSKRLRVGFCSPGVSGEWRSEGVVFNHWKTTIRPRTCLRQEATISEGLGKLLGTNSLSFSFLTHGLWSPFPHSSNNQHIPDLPLAFRIPQGSHSGETELQEGCGRMGLL